MFDKIFGYSYICLNNVNIKKKKFNRNNVKKKLIVIMINRKFKIIFTWIPVATSIPKSIGKGESDWLRTKTLTPPL